MHSNILRKLLSVALEGQEGKHLAVNVLNFHLVPQVVLRLYACLFFIVFMVIHSVIVFSLVSKAAPADVTTACFIVLIVGKTGRAPPCTMAPVYTLPDWDGKHAGGALS